MSPNQSVLSSWQGVLSPICPVQSVDDVESLAGGEQEKSIVLFHLDWLQTALGHRLLLSVLPNVNYQVVLLSNIPNPAEGLHYLQMGAYGYANTHLQANVLLKVIEVVALGQVWVNQEMMSQLIAKAPVVKLNKPLPGLTKREQGIAALVSEGQSNKAIALKLSITERTVKAHLTTIYKKTGCSDRLKLALWLNSAEDEATNTC
ncbi:MAG: response regulator transcription factor [Methylococcales bacterium]|nr:response regulator transcription factor [Methylococcales bacterium]MBT7445854.1 response regulator transcription factor [Methylococcales bacterium]